MGFIKEVWKLTRFEHALMLAFAVFIGETIILGKIPPLNLITGLSLLVPVFSEMGAFSLNDYLDIETDRLSDKKDRPLVRGTIAPKFALWFSVVCIISSTALGLLINFNAFIITLVFNLLSIAYNWKLKDLPLVGNLYIATTMAIPFIFGNYVFAQTLSTLAIDLALIAFVAGLAREIIKSVQDMEADKAARNSKTLPIVIGKQPAIWIAIALYILFVPLSISPFFLGLKQNIIPLLMVGVGNLIIFLISFKLFIKPDESFKFARDMSLVAFFIGMMGLLLAAIF